jgi:uncharacterized protein YcbK (DUF882 family)
MKLKEGVRLQGVQWQMFDAAVKVEDVYSRYGHELTITSGSDGQHSAKSLHYKGLALDIRTRNVPPSQLPKIERDIKQALGKDYDVVYEGDHFHIEYDPKA